MVSSRQTALAGADFDTWLSSRQIYWSLAQVEIVRRAYALGGEPELAVADLLAGLRMDHDDPLHSHDGRPRLCYRHRALLLSRGV